jgi:cold shock CspA family protein
MPALVGTVVFFDPQTGLGEVETDDGERLGFHATAIADGSRSISAGAAVVLERRATHLGRFEAALVAPLER